MWLRVVNRFLVGLASLCIVSCLEVHLNVATGILPGDLFNEDLYFEVLQPEDISYTYKIRPAKNFGGDWNRTWTNIELVLADPQDGCSFFYNAEFVAGKAVLMERGKCSFLSKTIQAEKSGAEVALIMDNDYSNDENYIDMIEDETKRNTGIPAAYILGKNGFMIKRALKLAGTESAIINIPVNMTGVPLHRLNQPPWSRWS